MALKDWKKTTNLEEQIDFEKDDKHYLMLALSEQGMGKKWIIYINGFKKFKFFKTKQQALKFAKAYMRSH